MYKNECLQCIPFKMQMCQLLSNNNALFLTDLSATYYSGSQNVKHEIFIIKDVMFQNKSKNLTLNLDIKLYLLSHTPRVKILTGLQIGHNLDRGRLEEN